MRRLPLFGSLAACSLVLLSGAAFAADELESIDEKATHKHTREIKVAGADGDQSHKVNAFCLDAKGNILAACGTGPGVIHVMRTDGEHVATWEVDFKPEAINTAPDGTVLVGGEGTLVRFDADGKELHRGDAPHAKALTENTGKLREEAIEYLNRYQSSPTRRNPKQMLERYEAFVKQLEAKKEKSGLSENEERVLASIKATAEKYRKEVAELAKNEDEPEEPAGPSESDIQERVKSMLARKMRIASVSTDGEHVYTATYAPTGYRFCVWKMNKDFTGGEVIVSELAGCCGNMDVQCCKNGLYVAENSRHRVAKYSLTGEEVSTWGKRDRSGIDGFTSCCNPMNVTFGKNGDVYTAESNTGRIKRFTADGKFVDYVGDVKLVPGCKNVSIAVSPDAATVYMLDITRNHIIVMEQQTDEPGGEKVSAASE